MFRNARQLPRNTVRVTLGGEAYEVTTFRGYQRENDELSACLDAGMHLCVLVH
jgi:hypothetical protein